MFADEPFSEGLWAEPTTASLTLEALSSSRRNLWLEAMWNEFPWAGEGDFLVIPQQPGLRFGEGSKVGQQQTSDS